MLVEDQPGIDAEARATVWRAGSWLRRRLPRIPRARPWTSPSSTRAGRTLDMGTAIDATPEASDGSCFFDAPGISARARVQPRPAGGVLRHAGFVNYPTEWWHWSYGDRYWAFVTGAPAALFGEIRDARIRP